MGDTSIQWTDKTWNPVRGCALVSPGCTNCYAMKQAHRFSGKGQPYEGLTRLGAKGGRPVWEGAARFVPEHLADPLSWRTPKRVFVNSMSDLFHEDVSNDEIAAVFGVMAACPQHTFQVLTKRAERMGAWFEWLAGDTASDLAPPAAVACGIHAANHMADVDYLGFRVKWPLPNVWLGVSVETQRYADERIPLLLATPAAVRFVSAEPLLEGVDLSGYLAQWYGGLPTPKSLDWVIVGGESGPGARPFCTAWAMNIVADCEEAGVSCFVKQLGARPYRLTDEADDLDVFHEEDVAEWLKLRDRKGGDPEEWPPFLRRREFPQGRRP